MPSFLCIAANHFLSQITWPYMAEAQQKTMKTMSFVIIPVGVLATLWIPAGLQFYFLLTASLQWLQSAAFYNPTLRRLLGLGPLHLGGVDPSAPKPKPGTWQAPRTLETTAKVVETEEPKASSALAGLKETAAVAREKIGEYNQKSKKKSAASLARELEERRALQEQEELIARREMKILKRRESK